MFTATARQDRGISLLFVVLIGSIMLLTSVAAGLLALRLVKSASVRSESVRAQYAAEASFNCVVYWLKQSVDDYFNGIGADTRIIKKDGTAASLTCMNTVLSVTGVAGSPSTDENTYKFSLTIDGDPVDVTVVRDMTVGNFRGTTTVMGRNMGTASKKQLEKLQEYYFEWPSVKPSDIMFVVDRSASIHCDVNEQAACSRAAPGADSAWALLVGGLQKAIQGLLPPGSPAHVGLVSFGGYASGAVVPTGYVTAGDEVGTPDGSGDVPEIRLTDQLDQLINDRGTPNDTADDTLTMKTGEGNTNTSLGLSIAGLSLMSKKYPVNGTFEKLVADEYDAADGSFSALDLSTVPDDPSSGETSADAHGDDTKFPDYIILVTDGQPNAIISHTTLALNAMSVNTYGNTNPVVETANPDTVTYASGATKLFLTYSPSTGNVEDNGYVSVNTGGGGYGLPAGTKTYPFCNDNQTKQPAGLGYAGGTHFGQNDAPNVAMCNAEIIADALKEYGNITIGVIGIGSTKDTGYQGWLENRIASKSADGTPIYQYAEDFDQFMEALRILIADKLELNKMR